VSRSDGPGSRLAALRRAERLVRDLAAIRDGADLARRGRELVREARATAADLDASSREPVDQAPG
jgi:hypothetical protein